MAIGDVLPTEDQRLELSREILRLELAQFEQRILDAKWSHSQRGSVT
jgi:hypothetical protein